MTYNFMTYPPYDYSPFALALNFNVKSCCNHLYGQIKLIIQPYYYVESFSLFFNFFRLTYILPGP